MDNASLYKEIERRRMINIHRMMGVVGGGRQHLMTSDICLTTLVVQKPRIYIDLFATKWYFPLQDYS